MIGSSERCISPRSKRGAAGDAADEFIDGRIELCFRNEARDQAHFSGAFGSNGFTGQNDFKRALGSDQSRFAADRSCVSQCVAVAREQKMIAIVDSQVGRRVVIRPATAAGLLRSLVDMHLEIRIRQSNGRREARNSSADDVDRVLHQMKA